MELVFSTAEGGDATLSCVQGSLPEGFNRQEMLGRCHRIRGYNQNPLMAAVERSDTAGYGPIVSFPEQLWVAPLFTLGGPIVYFPEQLWVAPLFTQVEAR